MPLLNATEIKLVMTCLIVYLTFINFFEWNEISIVKLSLAISPGDTHLIDGHNLSTFLETRDRAYSRQGYYPDKAPGLPLLASPIVRIFMLLGQPEGRLFWVMILVMTSLTSGIFTALTCLLLYRISSYFVQDQKYCLLVPIFYGFGSIALYYAASIKAHATATFFSFLCFYLVFKIRHEATTPRPYIFIAGLAGGIAFITEYQSAVVVCACLVLLIIARRLQYVNLFLIGLLPLFFVFLSYNYVNLGSPLSVSYSHYDIHTFRLGQQDNAVDFITGIIPSSITQLSVRLVDKSIRMLFFSYRGLLVYTPYLILSLFGFFFMFKKYPTETLTVWSTFLILIIFYVFSGHSWWGSTGFGNRFFLLVVRHR